MTGSLILMLFVTLMTSQLALGQSGAELGRTGGDKVGSEGGGGQSRYIYSQRHLSPHQMMHFGKRPSNFPPPALMTSGVHDLYQPERQQRQLHFQPDQLPYLWSIELERGQSLQAVPEEFQPSRHLMYNLQQPRLLPASDLTAEQQRLHQLQLQQLQQQQQLFQQVAKPLGEQRLMKLISSGESLNEDTGAVNNEDLATPERAQASTNSEDEDQKQQQAINVSTRSMQSARSNTLNLPKAYISSLLYGRQGASSLQNFGGYNKKAEPKDNFFMHFGRK